jgi:two-component system NtrC family sensor kinase
VRRDKNNAASTGSTARSYFKQLERRFQLGLILAFFIPLAGLSTYFHIQFTFTLKETGQLNLAAIAESQRNTVDLFLQERLVNILTLFYRPDFTLTPSQQQMSGLLQHLRQVSDAFIDVGFLNSEGLQIGYAGPYLFLQNKDYSKQEWFLRLMEPERTHYISDIYLGFRNKLHFTMAVKQVIDGNPYVLRATLDPDKFYLFLRTINHAGGVESFIVNAAGDFQSADPSRWQVSTRSPFTPAYAEQSGVQEIRQHGEIILIAHAWLKETPWALMVSEPLRHANATFYRARVIMLVSTAVITVIFVMVIWFSTHTLIGKAREHAEKREELYNQLLHASKLASLGELATGVAHEINNPLAIIMATTGLIKDRLNPEFDIDGSPEAVGEDLKAIDAAVLRARGITQRLLDYGHKSQPELTKTDVNQILKDVLNGFKSREFALANIELIQELDPNLPEIMADGDQIRQVFINLLNNAGDAINGPGRITVKSHCKDSTAHFSFTDTGQGMDSAQIEKIFDPFFTTKEVGKGTGLGLSVSLGIVESLGGTIEVQSLPGAGSEFTVTLPLDANQQ